MKKRLSFYITFACIAVFGSLGLMLLIRGEKGARPSDSENRMLAGFPVFSLSSVADGSFMEGMESYLSDAMPARNTIIVQTASWMNTLSVGRPVSSDEDIYTEVEEFGREDDTFEQVETIQIVHDPEEEVFPETVQTTEGQSSFFEEATVAPSAEPEETAAPVSEGEPVQTPAALEIKDPSVAIRTCTFVQLMDDGSSRLVYTFPKEHVANAVKVLNAYRKALPEDGHVFFSQIPFPGTAFALQTDKYTGWKSELEEILSANTYNGVEIVSALEVLEQPLLSGEDLYFHNDHHWKPRAASYVAQAMQEQIGINALSYDEYSFQHLGGFYGSKANASPEEKKKTKPDTIDVLIPNLPVKGYLIDWNKKETDGVFMVLNRHSYLAYLGGTLGPWRRYETGVDCGRNCLVIGDSYICAFVPFLAPYYEEIHTTDMRQAYFDAAHRKWSVSDYLKWNEIDDVYIVLSTSSGVNSSYMLSYLMRYL